MHTSNILLATDVHNINTQFIKTVCINSVSSRNWNLLLYKEALHIKRRLNSQVLIVD